MEKKTGNWARSLGDALSLATSFAAAVALGYFAGKYLDTRLGTAPYLMLLMLLAGVATGLKMMYDQAFGKGRFARERKKESDPENAHNKYQPSQEVIDRLTEAKKMLEGLDTEIISSETGENNRDYCPDTEKEDER